MRIGWKVSGCCIGYCGSLFILNVVLKCLKLKGAEQITQGHSVQEKVPELRLSIKRSPLLSPPEAKPFFSAEGAAMALPLDLLPYRLFEVPGVTACSVCLNLTTAPLKTFHTASLVLLHLEQNPKCSCALQGLEPSSHLHSCSIWLFQLSHAEHFALH